MSKTTKICRICEKEKAVELFELDKRVKAEGHRTNRCLKCKQSQTKKEYKAFYRLKERFPDDEIETSKEEVRQIFEVFKGMCAYCQKMQEDDPKTFHLEHIIPPSRGGRHHVSNLVISCDKCNRIKGDRPIGFLYQKLALEVRKTDQFILKYVSYFSGMTLEETERYFWNDYYAWKAETGDETPNIHAKSKNDRKDAV